MVQYPLEYVPDSFHKKALPELFRKPLNSDFLENITVYAG